MRFSFFRWNKSHIWQLYQVVRILLKWGTLLLITSFQRVSQLRLNIQSPVKVVDSLFAYWCILISFLQTQKNIILIRGEHIRIRRCVFNSQFLRYVLFTCNFTSATLDWELSSQMLALFALFIVFTLIYVKVPWNMLKLTMHAL